MQAAAPFTTFSVAGSEGDARRRRPGSRRSTSARTVYAGAAFAAPTTLATASQTFTTHRTTHTIKENTK